MARPALAFDFLFFETILLAAFLQSSRYPQTDALEEKGEGRNQSRAPADSVDNADAGRKAMGRNGAGNRDLDHCSEGGSGSAPGRNGCNLNRRSAGRFTSLLTRPEARARAQRTNTDRHTETDFLVHTDG